MSATPVAELRDVHKAYGARTALAGVSFAVRRGEVVALLGPNGAGKTTAIRILLGLRRPDAGEARLDGSDPSAASARRAVGSTPQETDMPETLRVGEVVDLVRRHYAAPLPREEVLERFQIADLAKRETGGLSGGQRRRVAVALAFAGNPGLAVLDEPSGALDRAARAALWEVIRSFAAAGRAILLTTHDLAEAEALATRIVLLEQGRVTVEGTTEEIRRHAGDTRIEIRNQRLPPLAHADRATLRGDRLLLLTHRPGALIRELVAAGADLDDLRVAPLSLEQALSSEEPP